MKIELMLIYLSLIFICIIVCSCSKIQQTYPNGSNNTGSVLSANTDTNNYDTVLVIMKDPAATDKAFDDWLAAVKTTYKPLNVKYYCPCDSTILMLQGKGVAGLSELLAKGGSTATKAKRSGKDGPAVWSKNINFSFSDSLKQTSATVNLPNYKPSNVSTVVAVIDSGIDTVKLAKRLRDRIFKSYEVVSCMGNRANNGWNFVNNTSDWRDDHKGEHGTYVAAFAANQVFVKKGAGDIKILPVKAFNSSGVGNLSDILCGMAYAKQLWAKIIIVSSGFYANKFLPDGTPDSSAYLLKTFIKAKLTDANILVAAASGNDVPGILDLRNLNENYFYPASFASSLRNVFAVTTVNEFRVDTFQNYSRNVVDIGVMADIKKDFTFYDPRRVSITGSIETRRGSSFAAPIFAGKLCAYYSNIEPVLRNGNTFEKIEILKILADQGVVYQNKALKVHEGYYTTK